ncbi:MAG TPA: pyridoxamine 5'-phosphate oxidase family protein [Burkholderiales bacterium]|nr:pyridoxamine 5'-phosphate oxidase family protein [Burkholderiales bacterium]
MFTPAVEAVQRRKGSRAAYARREEAGGWRTHIDDELRQFIEARTSAFLGTASRDGQPYIQHRGGPPGFLRVLDERTIGFADFAGNRQYISVGNLSENPQAFLFLIDYAERRRVKLWGEARVVEDAAVTARLAPRGYPARLEHAVVFHVLGWDENCPRHIPQLT